MAPLSLPDPTDARISDLLVELLELIRARSSFGLVMVTRVVDDDWHVVAATENPYLVAAGDVFRWSDSICSRMVGRPGPRWLLDDVDADAEAAVAPVRDLLAIASYAGAPIEGDDGELIGTVCAIDPDPLSPSSNGDLFAFAGHLASLALSAAPAAARARRDAERSLFRSMPAGPALMPASAWPGLLAAEADRCRWTGEALALGLLRFAAPQAQQRADLDQIATAVAARLHRDDALAVLGSNRLGILCPHRSDEELRSLLDAVVGDLGGDAQVAVAVSEVTGHEPDAVTNALEEELVGPSAAAARSTSQTIRYSFCDSCGRKGRYWSAAAGVERCKYCASITADPGAAATPA